MTTHAQTGSFSDFMGFDGANLPSSQATQNPVCPNHMDFSWLCHVSQDAARIFARELAMFYLYPQNCEAHVPADESRAVIKFVGITVKMRNNPEFREAHTAAFAVMQHFGLLGWKSGFELFQERNRDGMFVRWWSSIKGHQFDEAATALMRFRPNHTQFWPKICFFTHTETMRAIQEEIERCK